MRCFPFTFFMLTFSVAIMILVPFAQAQEILDLDKRSNHHTCQELLGSGFKIAEINFSVPKQLYLSDGFVPGIVYSQFSPREEIYLPTGEAILNRYESTQIPKKILYEGLKVAYGSYKKRVRSSIISLVAAIDAEIPPEEIRFILIKKGEQIVGMVRIVTSEFSQNLPAFRAFAKRDVSFEDVSTNKKSAEIGKYFVSNDLSASEHVFVRKLLLQWIINSETLIKEDEFYIHVGTSMHKDLFEKQFGFKPIFNHTFDGNTEWLLKIERADLATAIQNLK